MKKAIFPIILVVVSFSGCTSTKLASVSDDKRGEISWTAFCTTHGYDLDDNTYLTVNEYLDSWCGSDEEEKALIKAGIKP